MPPGPPPPIRVDRIQLEQALRPVVAAIEQVNVTLRDSFLPALANLAALDEKLERLRATRRVNPRR